MIRLDFPGFSGAQSLEPIGWDEWFQKFDESKLALLVQDKTARGQKSNFNKLIGRETAQARARGEYGSRRHPEGRKTSGRTQSKGTRGSTRGARTASVRGERAGRQQRRAA